MKIKILNLSSYNLQVARKRYSLLDIHEKHVDFIQDQKWTNYEPSVSFLTFETSDIYGILNSKTSFGQVW